MESQILKQNRFLIVFQMKKKSYLKKGWLWMWNSNSPIESHKSTINRNDFLIGWSINWFVIDMEEHECDVTLPDDAKNIQKCNNKSMLAQSKRLACGKRHRDAELQWISLLYYNDRHIITIAAPGSNLRLSRVWVENQGWDLTLF